MRTFYSVLFEKASRKVFASLITSLSIEIAARRDCVKSRGDALVLSELYKTYDALIYVWSNLEMSCSPEVYSHSFDFHASSLPKILQYFLALKISKIQSEMLRDLSTPLLSVSSENSQKSVAVTEMLELIAL